MGILNENEATASGGRAKRRDIPAKYASFLITALAVLLAWCVSFVTCPVFAADGDTPEQPPIHKGFKPSVPMSSVLVEEQLNYVDLFDRGSKTLLEIPGVTHLMVLYIASQRLPSDTVITVTEDIAAKNSEEQANGNIAFLEGDRLSLRFLLIHMLFNHSDAASLAIASAISPSPEAFVEEMQTTAELLGMEETTFYALETAENASTDPSGTTGGQGGANGESADDLPPQSSPNNNLLTSRGKPLLPVDTVQTTLQDTAKLVSAIFSQPRAASLFSETNPLVTFSRGDHELIASFRSPESSLITLSDGKIEKAAFFPSQSRYSLAINLGKTRSGIPILVVAADNTPANEDRDILNLYDDVEDFYEVTTLARKGERYEGAVEKAENGQHFNLVYLETASYVHPKNDAYLEPTIDYIGNAPYPLPVSRDDKTGQVTFTMLNGVRIQVPVGPDRDILPEESAIGHFINLLQQNQNIASVILTTGILIAVMLAVYVIKQILAVHYWGRLNRLENIAVSAHALIDKDERR